MPNHGLFESEPLSKRAYYFEQGNISLRIALGRIKKGSYKQQNLIMCQISKHPFTKFTIGND